MNSEKPWYKSKGVWGGIVTMLIGIVSMVVGVPVDLQLGPDEELVRKMANVIDLAREGQWGLIVGQIVTVGAGWMAFIGRLKAKARIG